ncbi:MAG: hypothetical protein J6M31_07980 [Bacteroidales bacterium]|nr:hypothetical protein [Bacteroidales bacterium]
MKKFSFILLAAAVAFVSTGKQAVAQEDCNTYASYYQEYYKQKNYQSALPNWRKAYALCPKNFKQNIYVHGATLMKMEIEKNIRLKNTDLAKAQYDTLLTLLDERLANYPTAKKGGVVVENKYELLNNKGNYIINYIALNGNDQEYLFKNLNDIVDQLGNKTNTGIIVNAFNASVALYRENKMAADEVIAYFEKYNGLLSELEAKNDAEVEENAKARSAVQSLFADSKVASCENLINIFGPRYEADPENLALVSNIVRLMNSAEDCASNELYLKAVTSMYKLDPSYRSAYALYRLNAARGNVADACRYLEDAIASPESDDATDAQYFYELAKFAYSNGMRGKAFDAAKKAIDLDASVAGGAYMIMGNLWASTPCSGEVDKYARYWVATDFYQKARTADPTLADDAASAIGRVSIYYPEASEIFMYDLSAGQGYTVSCGGMSASTTVRVRR